MIWVLTEEYNEYDQHGAYFVAAWPHEPSPTDLIIAGVSPDAVLHVLEGGGRLGKEYHWHNLIQEINPEHAVDMIEEMKIIAKAFGMEVRETKKKKTSIIDISKDGFFRTYEIDPKAGYQKMTLEDLVDDAQAFHFKDQP